MYISSPGAGGISWMFLFGPWGSLFGFRAVGLRAPRWIPGAPVPEASVVVILWAIGRVVLGGWDGFKASWVASGVSRPLQRAQHGVSTPPEDNPVIKCFDNRFCSILMEAWIRLQQMRVQCEWVCPMPARGALEEIKPRGT